MGRLLTNEQVIQEIKSIHKDRYCLDKVDYKGLDAPIILGCSIHGDFDTTLHRIKRGQGCPYCAGKRQTTESIIKRFEAIHGKKYDYSDIIYRGQTEDIYVKCSVIDKSGFRHKGFWTTPQSHLRGFGCPFCSGKKLTLEKFILESKMIHNNEYDYSKSEYNGNKKDITIICHKKDSEGKEHGVFWQRPNNHLNGAKCPKCMNEKRVKNELNVLQMLQNNFSNIKYQFKNKNILTNLSLDYFLSDYCIGIELQGEQHFRCIEFFGGKDGFLRTQQRDLKKIELCKEHGITLLHYATCEIPKNFDLYEVITSEEELINRIKDIIVNKEIKEVLE